MNFHQRLESIKKYGEPTGPDYYEVEDTRENPCMNLFCNKEIKEGECDFCEDCWEAFLNEEREKNDLLKELGMVTLTALATVLLFSVVLFGCQESHAEIDMGIIAHIESSGNPKAWNKVDDSRGLYQITPIALRDYNDFHTVDLTMEDMWNPKLNGAVAYWMLNERIPKMLKHYGKPVTIENIITAYNAGISYVVKDKPIPQITKDYIVKYRRAVK